MMSKFLRGINFDGDMETIINANEIHHISRFLVPNSKKEGVINVYINKSEHFGFREESIIIGEFEDFFKPDLCEGAL